MGVKLRFSFVLPRGWSLAARRRCRRRQLRAVSDRLVIDQNHRNVALLLPMLLPFFLLLTMVVREVRKVSPVEGERMEGHGKVISGSGSFPRVTCRVRLVSVVRRLGFLHGMSRAHP